MSSYKLKVIDRKGPAVKLGVWMTEPKQNFFYEEENFALQLLWDGLNSADRKEAPLGKEISLDNRVDPKWMLQNTGKFITSVDIPTTKNYPITEEAQQLAGKDFDKFWNDLKKVPYAEYEIKTTDQKWISHLKKGMAWDSSAINYEATA